MRPKLLLIGSEDGHVLTLVSKYLQSYGFEVHRAREISESRVLFNNFAYSILVVVSEAGETDPDRSTQLQDQLSYGRSVPTTILLRYQEGSIQKLSSYCLDETTAVGGKLLMLDLEGFIEEISAVQELKLQTFTDN